jgi:hypothetical protein
MVEEWVGDAAPVDEQIAFMCAALVEYTAEEMVEDILQLAYLDS